MKDLLIKEPKCLCEEWMNRLWYKNTFSDSSSLIKTCVKFNCSEHGEICLDNRDNPVPHVDAKDPVRSYVASRMSATDAERKRKDQENRKNNPWKYRRGVRC